MQNMVQRPFIVSARSGLVLTAGWMVALTVVSGCGWFSSPHPVAVSGTIKLNGTPLKSGVISFRPVDRDRGSFASGQTDQDGHYKVETLFVGPGILPGDYLVGILAQEDSTKYTPEEYNALVGPGKPGIPSLVPAHITDPEKSGLKVTIVAPGPQTYDLDIEGKPADPRK